MAPILQKEAATTPCGIILHPSIEHFLQSSGSPTKIDESTISEAIGAAAAERLPEIALKDKPTTTAIASYEPGPIKIAGYATPQSSVIAVAFEAPFTFWEMSYETG
jgi:hypothetical protein